MKKLTNTKIPSCTKTKCQCSAGCILRPKIWVAASILYYVQSYEVQSLLYSPSKATRCSVCCILHPKLWDAESIVFSVQNYEMPSQLYSPYSPSKNMSYRVSCILRPKLRGEGQLYSRPTTMRCSQMYFSGPKYAQNYRLVTESLWTYKGQVASSLE